MGQMWSIMKMDGTRALQTWVKTTWVPCRWMTPHPVISATLAPSAANFYDQPDMKLTDSWDVSQNWMKPTFWLLLTSNDIRARWKLSSAQRDAWNNVKRILDKPQTPESVMQKIKKGNQCSWQCNMTSSNTWNNSLRWNYLCGLLVNAMTGLSPFSHISSSGFAAALSMTALLCFSTF